MTKRDKVTVDDIIGIVHTDETTNSVEEVKKLRGRTNDRFIVDTAGTLVDMVTRDTFDYVSDVVGLLNKFNEENEQLKMGIDSLKLLVQNWEALDEEKDEQLDKQNQQLKKLKKENEQLKSEIKDLNDILARYEEKELKE